MEVPLVNFSVTAEEWENEYFNCLVNKKQWDKKIIAVTDEERAEQLKVENQSKAEIERQIFACLEAMDGPTSELYEDM